MQPLDYIIAGMQAVIFGPAAFELLGVPIPLTLVMVFAGVVTGILVGATPGLAGPMAMAISLPILISFFGYNVEALLPVLGFLIGIMKGATLGGAVPAILFNTPGTPDAYMTTLDGYPLTKQGQSRKALKVAHLSSVSGDTFSDIALFVCAPFVALMVERHLDFPEKTALLILSLSFIAAVIGGSPGKGLISVALGLIAVFIGGGEDFYPRLSLGTDALAGGFSIMTAILGVLIVGAVLKEYEDLWHRSNLSGARERIVDHGDQRLTRAEVLRIAPYIGQSSIVGTLIGALPGIGTTLAAALGYQLGRVRNERRRPEGAPAFGEGAIEGVAATEAANSSVSGSNLIPVLGLGIPGNAAAVFIILATDSIGGFTPGPSVFRFSENVVNTELVLVFGLFTAMLFANLVNWTFGGAFMRAATVMVRVPKRTLLPVVLLLTFTAVYAQEPSMASLWFTLSFGILGYLMRKVDMSPLPFVIAFVLGGSLENSARQAFSATGGDPYFLFSSWISIFFLAGSVVTVVLALRQKQTDSTQA
ncbi:hypothetical protein GV827_21575 [Sulfitobacter sp. JBTF-M27]|uniref:DUF112 domain-containing protein n=1 Tax=Sulfitobacter sediminilitoris TaxID=2698830 RepID=A0A6P0CKA9_9RHOB|nr:tripartite tricarboxylate transporter permease [Sulfitobacter sediminilitoris]NEK24963.1 hypothetical protein [Sulfitobacter sediminilitoris]